MTENEVSTAPKTVADVLRWQRPPDRRANDWPEEVRWERLEEAQKRFMQERRRLERLHKGREQVVEDWLGRAWRWQAQKLLRVSGQQ